MLLCQKLNQLKILYFILVLLTACLIIQTDSRSHSKQSVMEKLATAEYETKNVFDEQHKTMPEKLFPQDIGWIDIKKDYGAKGDGKTDD